MAFKMNRPIIKGTKLHKNSVIKAKTDSIVSQARTQADPGLIQAGRELGESIIGGSIDYKLPKMKIDFSKRKEKEDDDKMIISESKGTDYGTYQEYVDEHNKLKEKMGDKDKEAFGDPISEDEWYSKEEHKNIRRPEQDYVEITPRTTSLRPLPTNSQLGNLQTSSQTVASTQSRDRFEEAAERFGYDLSTPEGYEEAENAMEYNDRTDTWINPRATVSNVTTEKVDPKEDETLKEIRAKEQELIDKANKEREERLAEKKRKQEEEIRIKKEAKRKEIEAKNVEIRKRNKVKQDARDYYGKDVVLTQERLDDYISMMEKQKEALNYELDIEEEDSPEPDLEKYISDKPNLQPKTTDDKKSNVEEKTADLTPKNLTKPKPSDFKDKKNAFGGRDSKMDQYRRALKKYYKDMDNVSAMQKRDDRIFKNAIKGGVVQKEMLKRGYKNGI